MRHWLRYLRYRPALLVGFAVAVLVAIAAARHLRPITACLIGWDLGVAAYGVAFVIVVRRSTTAGLARTADLLDEGNWGVLLATIVAALASLGAIVIELAQAHGKPHAPWSEALAGATVLLSWFFIHTIFATHYAHEFWRDATGLLFPGNDKPDYPEFLYFSFCMAVASQVSDVTTQNAGMRKLVLAHSLVAYLFNTAIIALGVNIAASLAS
ncbi:DUF1345 domain-containing protein [Lichenicoccus sp.]|uniref:DUF1345 domain-containing protein n=1 Tax=Lichenicoccus sp. TaxID=2781899 RepID=UPI003D11B24C